MILIAVAPVRMAGAGGEFPSSSGGTSSLLACLSMNGTALRDPSKMPRIKLSYGSRWEY
jgi:hypothetical protein